MRPFTRPRDGARRVRFAVAKLGSALGMSVDGNLAVAAYDLYEFDTTPGTTRADGAHPQRLAPSS